MELDHVTAALVQRRLPSAAVPTARIDAPRRERLPALLVGPSDLGHPNVRYRCHMTLPDPCVIVDQGPGRVTLWVNRMEYHRAQVQAKVDSVRCYDELDAVRQPHSGRGKPMGLVEAILREHGLKRVAVDGQFPAATADALRRRGMTVIPKPTMYLAQRRIKNEAELAAVTATQNAGMEGLQRAIDMVASSEVRDDILWHQGRPLTSRDLIAAVETRLVELSCGTEDSICCGGPENADPHRTQSDVIRVGLPVVLDIYPFSKSTGYWGDMTRTVVRGTPPPEVAAMWEAVKAAQQAGLDAIRAGVNARDVHLACCRVFLEWGFLSDTKGFERFPDGWTGPRHRARFVHSTGHGIGLQVHEQPRVADVDVTLRTGDLITVEPGLYDPRFGGIRIEDLVVVTRDGHRNLTPLAKQFRLDG